MQRSLAFRGDHGSHPSGMPRGDIPCASPEGDGHASQGGVLPRGLGVVGGLVKVESGGDHRKIRVPAFAVRPGGVVR
jgi:hypothetical protein